MQEDYYDNKFQKHLSDLKFLFSRKGLLVIAAFIIISFIFHLCFH